MNVMTVSVKDLRDQLADQVNRVAYVKQPVIVTKHGKPVAALVSMGDYERVLNPRLRFGSDQEWDRGFGVIDKMRTLNRRKTGVQIEKLVNKALLDVRAKSRS